MHDWGPPAWYSSTKKKNAILERQYVTIVRDEDKTCRHARLGSAGKAQAASEASHVYPSQRETEESMAYSDLLAAVGRTQAKFYSFTVPFSAGEASVCTQ